MDKIQIELKGEELRVIAHIDQFTYDLEALLDEALGQNREFAKRDKTGTRCIYWAFNSWQLAESKGRHLALTLHINGYIVALSRIDAKGQSQGMSFFKNGEVARNRFNGRVGDQNGDPR